MDEPSGEDEPCGQCGLCCRIFGPGISPTVENLYLWMEQQRTDILRWFTAFMEDGRVVPCTALKPEDLMGVVSAEMRDPDSGEFVTACPFLRRVSRQRYLCGIHTVKPEMCSNYRPWIWKESCFGRCLALDGTRHPRHWAA